MRRITPKTGVREMVGKVNIIELIIDACLDHEPRTGVKETVGKYYRADNKMHM